jgi:hypothetical protein
MRDPRPHLAPQVLILTYCREPSLLASGTLLVFRTLRIGFPTAEVTVIDNASVPEARPAIRAAAEAAGCEYIQRDPEIVHAEFLREVILGANYAGSVVLLDPDVIFWSNCEGWRIGRLLAGRMLPEFMDEFTRCRTLARLHTSFLWIRDVAALRERVSALMTTYFDFDPFPPRMFAMDGAWYRGDTMAFLCGALPEEVQPFGEEELNAYDHLFCGSHLDLVLRDVPHETQMFLKWAHAQALADPSRLRGLWRQQEDYFRLRSPAGTKGAPYRPVETG